jgi:hypothetical protein
MRTHYLARNRQAVGVARRIALVTESLDGKGNAMNETITRYLQCWNETDDRARRALVEELFAANASYVDPMVELEGRDAIDAAIAAVQAQFPGMVFTQLGEVDAHHRQARFGWGLGPVGSAPLVEGFDVAVLDEHGRVATVLGFLDKVPS